tara:strand:- start:4299 stop:5249 length:951 start_codon:yes stop_codon:yes gene_type:complete
MKERLYLFLGLFFVTIPAFAEPATTAMLISAGVSALSSIFGGIGAGSAKRRAERRERAAAANRMALEANRADIPNFGSDFENPAANLQVATQGSLMAAEQADISLASTLDTLRATGASAGGATALARAAAQSKRGVSAQIEQQEARNAQLRAQGETQAAQMRQRAQTLQFQATTARENQALNRAASLESSYSQQTAAYGAQQSQMLGQAVGALGTFASFGGFGAEGPFAKTPTSNDNVSKGKIQGSATVKTPSEKLIENRFKPDPNIDMSPTPITPYTAPNFGNVGISQVPGLNNLSQFAIPGLTAEQLRALSINL